MKMLLLIWCIIINLYSIYFEKKIYILLFILFIIDKLYLYSNIIIIYLFNHFI